jgi:hypothetical protein
VRTDDRDVGKELARGDLASASASAVGAYSTRRVDGASDVAASVAKRAITTAVGVRGRS